MHSPDQTIIPVIDRSDLSAGSDREINAKIERLEKELLPYDQIDCPLQHRFAPGLYLREIFMPAGTFVIGHEHKTEHFNFVMSGRASVMMNGKVHQIQAPCIIKSSPGVRKILYIHEDMVWATVHPTEETEISKLEDLLIVKSESYRGYHKSIEEEIRVLKEAVEEANSEEIKQ